MQAYTWADGVRTQPKSRCARISPNLQTYEWHVAHTKNLDEEEELIEAEFEQVGCNDKDEVAIYRKRR